MKKSTLIIIGISLVLVILAAASLLTKKSSTLENDFLIYDTASVEKIFIAAKNNTQVSLTKKDNQWYVNDDKLAIYQNVTTILKTMIQLEIQRPVSKSGRNTVIKQMATNSVKVEIYQNKFMIDFWGLKLMPKLKKTKVFYVGSPTRNYKGTMMKMEDSDDIYITYLPGFNGYLTERFSANYADWLNHNLFKIPIKAINSVKVVFSEEPSQSYEIQSVGARNFDLIAIQGNQKMMNYDTTRLLESLASFRNINYENLLDDLPQTRCDSLKNSVPARIVTINTIDQQSINLRMYRRPNYDQKPDFNGDIFPYDMDRMYAFMDGIEYPITVQYFVVDNISRPLDYLLGTKADKKESLKGFQVGSDNIDN
jgi:hypothetical protein